MKTAVLMGAVDGTKLKNDQEKKHMQPKENKWKEQIRSLVITPNAILKSSILSVLWLAAGFALGLFYNYGISVIFIVVFLGILWLFPFWQPAFLLVYFIAGNR
ncbi:MAG: hypothetical protein HYZ23_08930, partial [Chloroflexi bacterium]|nr:hypothetical protein [Chloroflexota bacterium]